MWFVIGLFVGVAIGLIMAFGGQLAIEKEAVKNGYVKLDGKIYLIESFPRPGDFTKEDE